MAEIINDIRNRIWYLLRRNDWMLNPFSYFYHYEKIAINSPIFLLGFQGGGSTLISRMLRRHPQVVSVSGNYKYWSGADEMQAVLEPILPLEFTGTGSKVPFPDHPLFKSPRSWTYACNELLPYYRKTAKDATSELKRVLERVIRMSIARHAVDKQTARFVDKSQVYTVRVSFIRELLKEYHPKFVLVTTNPYASCYRAAIGKAADMKRLQEKLSFEERLNICAQHWANSILCAHQDRKEDMLIIRFEDVLLNPEKSIRKICEHVELDFTERMLPHPDDKVPLGSRFRDRWYPIDPQRALHYIDEASADELSIIAKVCGDLADELGYPAPRKFSK